MSTRSLSPWWKAGAKGGSFSKPLLSNSSHSAPVLRDAQAPGDDGQPREQCGPRGRAQVTEGSRSNLGSWPLG